MYRLSMWDGNTWVNVPTGFLPVYDMMVRVLNMSPKLPSAMLITNKYGSYWIKDYD